MKKLKKKKIPIKNQEILETLVTSHAFEKIFNIRHLKYRIIKIPIDESESNCLDINMPFVLTLKNLIKMQFKVEIQ